MEKDQIPAIERASDAAYTKIRQAILSGEFPRGKKLSKRAMAHYCGVSIIPVIDALVRLESDGLVESSPYYGSRVIDFNDARIEDSYLMREAIEAQIVRVLCYTIGIDELEDLKEMALDIDKLAGKEHDDEYYNTRHYEFHRRLAVNTRSALLVDSLEKLQLFTLLVRSEEDYRKQPNIIADYSHADIVDAIGRRKPEEASSIMRNHIYRAQVVKKPLWV